MILQKGATDALERDAPTLHRRTEATNYLSTQIDPTAIKPVAISGKYGNNAVKERTSILFLGYRCIQPSRTTGLRPQ